MNILDEMKYESPGVTVTMLKIPILDTELLLITSVSDQRTGRNDTIMQTKMYRFGLVVYDLCVLCVLCVDPMTGNNIHRKGEDHVVIMPHAA
jgi:hypothetical protein